MVGVSYKRTLFEYILTGYRFIPGHSLETFPEDMAAVRDAGHEIGLHGYSHENPVDMTIEQQRDVLDKTYRMLTEFAGKPPRGSVAPWYARSGVSIRFGWLITSIGGKQVVKVPSYSSHTASNMITA
jgi:peptidoglycan/xylan/chitin deacetylase (PgdA/CDA1 family)